MQRLTQFDITNQFLSRPGKLTAQVVFGLVCAGAMIGLRAVFDIFAPTSGPFALIYPTVLLATLYGHWRAGIVALLTTFFWAWYYVLPGPASWTFTNPTDPARVMLNFVCCLIVLVFAEAFRKAAHSTMAEIRKAADRRLALLAELEHRTKNNFALVASMLEIQKRRLPDTALHRPLDDAVGRVRTFADAYSNLDIEQAEDREVGLRSYLDILLDRLEKAAFPDAVSLYREIDNIELPRETAVAIGLYVNEALSNALKYAFPDDRAGTIGVYFHVDGDEWRLSVEDNGVGEHAVPIGEGGLGSSLMAAFAKQAGARHAFTVLEGGFRATLSTQKEEVQPA